MTRSKSKRSPKTTRAPRTAPGQKAAYAHARAYAALASAKPLSDRKRIEILSNNLALLHSLYAASANRITDLETTLKSMANIMIQRSR